MAFLAIEKLDAHTGLPIPGAVYLLQQGAKISRIFTDENGQALFYLQASQHYSISEGRLSAPYLQDNTIYDIFVCADSTVLVDGIPIKKLILLGYKKAES